jgi:hypothetical protein
LVGNWAVHEASSRYVLMVPLPPDAEKNGTAAERSTAEMAAVMVKVLVLVAVCPRWTLLPSSSLTTS